MSDEIEPDFAIDDDWWSSLMERYLDGVEFDEMRRFVSLWICSESMAVPEKMADTAQKIERFLKGSGPRAVE